MEPVKKCRTCVHVMKTASEEPCYGCFGSALHPNWTDGKGADPITGEAPKSPLEEKLERAAQVVSDGGPTSYYELPIGATELRHAIAYKQMGFARGNVFKAMYRLGEKDGTTTLYDINKCRLFLDDIEEALQKGYRV